MRGEGRGNAGGASGEPRRAPRRARPGPAGSAGPSCATCSSTSACRRCARAIVAAEPAQRAWSRSIRLRVYVCDQCFLVQLQEYVTPEEIFTEYAYFSSYSDTWLAHAAAYVDMITARLQLSARQPRRRAGEQRRLPAPVVRRDGHPRARHRAGRATSPTVAAQKGVPDARRVLRRASWRAKLVARGRPGRPARRQQRAGAGAGPQRLRRRHEASCSARRAWSRSSSRTCMRLIEENQFDTIYHEHFSYFSLLAAERIFAAHGLRIFDVEELPTHGGSLRIYACHADNEPAGESAALARAAAARAARRATPTSTTYAGFDERVTRDEAQAAGVPDRREASGQDGRRLRRPGQGQHAAELLRHPHRLPRLHGGPQPVQAGQVPAGHAHPDPCRRSGSRETRPDYILILPWNLKDEIIEAAGVRSRVGRASSSCRSPKSRIY